MALSNFIKFIKKINRQRNLKTKYIKNLIATKYLNSLKKEKSVFQPHLYKKVAILMNDQGIGDAIVTSFLIYELRKNGIKVSVIVEERIAFLFNGFIQVDEVIYFNKKQSIKKQLKRKVDLVIDLIDPGPNSYRRMKLISNLAPLHTIGFNQENNIIYDSSIKYNEYHSHITTRAKIILNFLKIHYDNVIGGYFSNFFVAAAVISQSDLVISVDTSMVHIANAYNKKLICIYNNRVIDHFFENNYVWGPNYYNAIQLFTEENQGTALGDNVANMDITELLNTILIQLDNNL